MIVPDNAATTALANSASLTTSAPGGLHERLVLAALEKMDDGHLLLQLPDGTIRHLGTQGHPLSANLRVLRPAFFTRVLLYGDVGFGEAYVDGDCDTDDIEKLISWAILNLDKSPAFSGSRTKKLGLNLLQVTNRVRHLLRPNSRTTARRNISEHYDLGNDFYQLWLDPTMTYSSALWKSPDQTLEQAQTEKYDALCRQLRLTPADHLLEIGSGWGGLASHAVRHYGCRVTTVTISQKQHEYAAARFVREGIADRIDLRLQDYRDITGTFDKVVSIEMMEALGDKYLETYFAKIHEVLAPHGLAALQYITCPDSRHGQMKRGIDWIQKHIFPGSLLLSIGRVSQAAQRTGDLFLHRLDDMGLDYARTLREWHTTFNARLPEVRALGFDERFVRRWNYYLLYCAAAFAMRNISVVQAIYTRPNNPLLR
ncbi:MAG: cyclopropane-fatty-acyl-phospholipid synthase [Verrucomicrobiales bacterium]|nr:cyclopropane-fatty-acyl-phospholipid synthase [Verrucomicrobiales bacterium]